MNTQQTQDTREALEPCPLCAGTDAFTFEDNNLHPNEGWWGVRCSSCDLHLTNQWSEAAARAAWNRRATPPSTAPAAAGAQPVAWRTHHDEPMLFPTKAEAAEYCDDDEQPEPLYAAAPTASADARDAARWRAFLACARIRMFGWAGVGDQREPGSNYVHFGGEFWSFYSEDFQMKPEQRAEYALVLTEFADAALAQQAAEGGKHG